MKRTTRLRPEVAGLRRGRRMTRMIANDEARMSNDEGMTKIRMPNLRGSVQSGAEELVSVSSAASAVKQRVRLGKGGRRCNVPEATARLSNRHTRRVCSRARFNDLTIQNGLTVAKPFVFIRG